MSLNSSKTPVRLAKTFGPLSGVGGGGGIPEPSVWVETFAINEIAATNQTGNFDLVSDSSSQPESSFTLPGTPKACIIITATGDSISTGYATGSAERFFLNTTQEFSSDPINANSELNDNRLGLTEDGDTTEVAFDFVSFLPNGVRINITTNTAGAFAPNFTVIVFGGTSLLAKAITHNLDGNAVDNTIDVTTVGFEPELVLSMAGNSGHTTLGRQPNCVFNFGITHNDGGADPQPQFGFTWETEDGTNAQQLRSQHRNTNEYALISENNAGANLVAAELLSFDASGFTVHCREATSWGTTKVGSLCLSWQGDADIHLQAFDSETTNITQTHTEPGFKPDWMLLAMNRSGSTATESAGANDDLAGGVALAWTSPRDGDPDPDETGTDIRGRLNCLGDDNNGAATLQKQTTVNATGTTTQPLNPTRTGSMSAAQFFRADFESFDASGYTIDYVDAASGVKSVIALAIRDNTV